MNTFNVVVDTWNVFGDDTETMLIVYAVCHMVGMSSVSSLNCCVWNFFRWKDAMLRKQIELLPEN